MLEVLVLGTAAGGGFPQWNCACENCRAARTGLIPPRLQSSVAISGNGHDWHLVNVSPDVAHQLERFVRPRLLPAEDSRRSPIGRIFLTNADLDHTLGIFHLREGAASDLTAPAGVRASLERGLSLGRVLDSYGGVTWHDASGGWQPVDASGLEFRAVPLESHAPRYEAPPGAGPHAVGFLFRRGGATVGIFPDVAAINPTAIAAWAECSHVWFDGTFWSEDEMQPLTGRTASAMGHIPISGDTGSLQQLSSLGLQRFSYLHINNTNPILRADSVERHALEQTGARVAEDGDHFVF